MVVLLLAEPQLNTGCKCCSTASKILAHAVRARVLELVRCGQVARPLARTGFEGFVPDEVWARSAMLLGNFLTSCIRSAMGVDVGATM